MHQVHKNHEIDSLYKEIMRFIVYRLCFPCETRQILSDHCDEVWFCQFSHNGRYLATGSKESRVFIWEVNPLTKRLRRKNVLEGHNYGASFFAWSSDDRYLAVVGPEDGPDLWVWNMEVRR